MFVCIECGCLFDTPVYWEERHGLDTPPYEQWSGCPRCYENYIEAFKCDFCGEYITSDYIKTEDDEKFCDNCYRVMELKDEL